MSHDTLSGVVRSVRLRSAAFHNVSCDGQWVAAASASCDIAAARHARGVARQRVSRAHGRLDGHASVASIALDVGYDSEAAFARAFKRVVGTPPAAWRRAHTAATARAPT
jgi:AraC-like DNA-binding protein